MAKKTVISIDTKFPVAFTGKKKASKMACHGTLRVGKKGIKWVASGAYQTQRKMSWELFATIMEFDAC